MAYQPCHLIYSCYGTGLCFLPPLLQAAKLLARAMAIVSIAVSLIEPIVPYEPILILLMDHLALCSSLRGRGTLKSPTQVDLT